MIVIQSEAKNLGDINVDVFEILRHYVPLNDILFSLSFDISLKIRTFASDEAKKIHSLDVNGSQHGHVGSLSIASPPSSGNPLLATRCGSVRVFPRLCRTSRPPPASSSRGALLARQACLRFSLHHSFSDGYTRTRNGGCLSPLFLLFLALCGVRYFVYSFAHSRIEGKTILLLFRETTFYVSQACSGASCASCLGLIKTFPSLCVVIQSVAKDLVYIKVDVFEILRFALNDKNAQDDT